MANMHKVSSSRCGKWTVSSRTLVTRRVGGLDFEPGVGAAQRSLAGRLVWASLQCTRANKVERSRKADAEFKAVLVRMGRAGFMAGLTQKVEGSATVAVSKLAPTDQYAQTDLIA